MVDSPDRSGHAPRRQTARLATGGRNSRTGGASRRWLTVSVEDATRLVSVDDVPYFQASEMYTEIVTSGERLVIRTPLKALTQRLDPKRFAQVHRGVIVVYAANDRVEHDLPGRLRIRVRGQREMLPVSRAHAGLLR
ncbi:LytTR family transcriptional regulator [Burkholderia sp. Bp9031]|nr:LytTR family transcriptional regulator [Burkholderia sp. Bp9031]